MKKNKHVSVKITVLLCCLCTILFSFSSAMGAENSELRDVSGTPFFTPVVSLHQAGIIAGYPDSTFRPFRNLSRAEAVTMIYRAYGSSSLALASPYFFRDVAPDMWAAPYINYGAGAGMITGYPDGTFQPDADITYNEVIALMIRARGLDSDHLSWPDGYVRIARDDGMLDGLYEVSLPSDGNAPANRGNTAVLIASGSEYNTTAADDPVEDILADPDMACICYGLMRETASGTDKLGNRCGWGRLLMGATTYDILSSNQTPGLFAGYNPAYGLFRVRIENGRATSTEKLTSAWSATRPRGLVTPSAPDPALTEFCRITSMNGGMLFWQADTEQNGTISLGDKTVCYEISLTGDTITASPISFSEIRENDMAAVYSLSREQNADVVIIVHPDSQSDILHATGNANVMYMG